MKRQSKTNAKYQKDNRKEKFSRRKNSLKKNKIIIDNKNSTPSFKSNKYSYYSSSKAKTPKIARKNINYSPVKNFQFTETQKNLLDLYEKEFNKKSIGQLKAILRENNQIMSGNKGDLVERCSQGKLLGALPCCSKCGGGKLKFNIKTGVYFCPGYMDDTEFRNCSFKADFKDVIRNPWID
jgi:hypothetical protein